MNVRFGQRVYPYGCGPGIGVNRWFVAYALISRIVTFASRDKRRKLGGAGHLIVDYFRL